MMECSQSGLFCFKEQGRGQVPWEHVKFSGVLGQGAGGGLDHCATWLSLPGLCQGRMFAALERKEFAQQ